MRLRPAARPRRRGAVFVESAFVLAIFLLFMFGIFEYCRYLFVLQVVTNATRDAARYAVVNVDKPSNFDATDYTDTTVTPNKTYKSVKNYCNYLMAGMDKNINGYTVSVFPCDASALNATPPVAQSKSGSPAWNQASFTEKIGVKISGSYTPFMPTFLRMPTSITINIVSICGSEG